MVGRWLEDGWKMRKIWNNMGQSSHAGQLFKGEMDVSYVEDGKRWENDGDWRMWRENGTQRLKIWHIHGSLNVPIEHHPTIRYMVYNGYYKGDVQYSQNGTVTNPWYPWSKKCEWDNCSVTRHIFPRDQKHHDQRVNQVDSICNRLINPRPRNSTCQAITGWWFQPLWKIWVCQLGLLYPIYGKIIKMCQATNQIKMMNRVEIILVSEEVVFRMSFLTLTQRRIKTMEWLDSAGPPGNKRNVPSLWRFWSRFSQVGAPVESIKDVGCWSF